MNIRVRAVADLGGPAIAISYDDAAALLAADRDSRFVVRTVAVLAGAQEHTPPGWRLVAVDAESVGLRTSSAAGHRAGCAA
ncbi:hypothetical protein [Mycobacterium sp. SA01]|uniref:hypothetical protein n=1 Tax=Mycobacterium sp. SA01 TaxID=3238820 RepID=UPI00351BA5F4